MPLHYYRIHSNNVNGGTFRYNSKIKLIDIFQNNIIFYKRLKNRFEFCLQKNNSILNNKIIKELNEILYLNEAVFTTLNSKRKLKLILVYLKLILFKELSLNEKIIFFFYLFLKN